VDLKGGNRRSAACRAVALAQADGVEPGASAPSPHPRPHKNALRFRGWFRATTTTPPPLVALPFFIRRGIRDGKIPDIKQRLLFSTKLNSTRIVIAAQAATGPINL